jgi:ribokinase
MDEHHVVVLGGINTDYLVKGERLPEPGETLQGEVFQEALGGKGANQAVAAIRLGSRAALIARVGRDERGESMVARLAGEGVDVAYVRKDQDALTGAALIFVDRSGQKQILTALGANRRVTDVDVDRARNAIESAKVLLAQLEVPPAVVGRAFRLARAAGVKTILDPAPAVPLSDDILRLVDVVRPNASEAETLTGAPVRDRPSARRAADILLRRGVGAVVVQAGEAGDLLVTATEERFFPRLQVDRVDATGAGDAFAAALAVGLAEERPLAEAAALGNAAAALATTRLGAQPGLPRRSEVLELLTGTKTPPRS